MRKCRHDFFRDGDSGVFVYFLDERGKKQAFGYSVRELLNVDWDPQHKYYLSFKLSKALRELFGPNHESCGCFNVCLIDDAGA